MIKNFVLGSAAAGMCLLLASPVVGVGHGGGHCSKRHDFRLQRAERSEPKAKVEAASSAKRDGSVANQYSCGLLKRLSGACRN